MSHRLRITPRAYEDLRAIARYGRQTWGHERSKRYLKAIDKRFQWLADAPQRGKPRDDIAPGYRAFREGEHLIFYIIRDSQIDIIGIPHQAMDIDGYFDL